MYIIDLVVFGSSRQYFSIHEVVSQWEGESEVIVKKGQVKKYPKQLLSHTYCKHNQLYPTIIKITVKIKLLGQIGWSKQCRPWSDCSLRSSLIRVYSVCYSVCIFWTQCCIVKSNCSNCRTLTVIILGVPVFRIFTVLGGPGSTESFSLHCSTLSSLGV